jgi:hypothetical protein
VPLFFGWLYENTRLCHGRKRVWRPRRLALFSWTLFCNRWRQLIYLYYVRFVAIIYYSIVSKKKISLVSHALVVATS